MRALGPFGAIFGGGGLSFRGGVPSGPFRGGHPPLTPPMPTYDQDDSNDTPQPICECQVDFPLLWIKDYPGLS